MIADMSLPDFSEGSIIDHSPHLPGEDDGNWIEGFPRNRELSLNLGDYKDIDYFPVAGEDEDVPYEGHSITLRDILIRTGNGEDTFQLICTASRLVSFALMLTHICYDTEQVTETI